MIKSFVPIQYNQTYQTALLAFLEQCLPESGRALDIQGRHSFYLDIENNFLGFRCMFDEDNIIGAVAIRKMKEDNCELKSLYLLEKYHGKGYGRKLIQEAIVYAKEHGYKNMYLDTLSTSKKAIALYRKAGFKDTEQYLQSVRSDVFMVLDLKTWERKMSITIRTASIEDAPKLLEIYEYYIKNTAITFEFEVPTLAEFEKRIETTLQNYPYLVAEVDGDIAGYVYASRFRTRAAYDWSVETSIYLSRKFQHLGIGRMLYERLEEILKKQNVINLYAGAADPVEEDEYLTRNSERFHEAIGYKTVAKYNKCGSKFGRWYNLISMEKIIGEHCCPPKEFIPFSDLKF